MTSPTTIIKPARSGDALKWKELVEYRDLFVFWTLRSTKVRYAQIALGIGWAIIQPLFSMLVFTVIFGKLARIDSNGGPWHATSVNKKGSPQVNLNWANE